jgi:hypothetical protein
VTQSPDRGRHPRGCRPKWPQVFNLRNSLCRLKTCTHFRAGCLEEVASHHIWVRKLRGSRRDAALAAVASSAWPSKSGPGTPRASRANHGLHPTTHSPTRAGVRSRIGRARSMWPRMRSSITGLAAQIRLIVARHAPAVGPGGAAADRHGFHRSRGPGACAAGRQRVKTRATGGLRGRHAGG